MKKSYIVLMIVVLAGLVTAGLVVANRSNDPETESSTEEHQMEMTGETTNEDEAAEEPAASQTSMVSIEGFNFSPSTITIKKGTTVTWTNKDSTIHTVTPDEEAGLFGSGSLDQGETYRYTFDTAGTFSYHCEPHPEMKGTVTVTE